MVFRLDFHYRDFEGRVYLTDLFLMNRRSAAEFFDQKVKSRTKMTKEQKIAEKRAKKKAAKKAARKKDREERRARGEIVEAGLYKFSVFWKFIHVNR